MTDIVKKADLALSELETQGGILDAEHQDNFYRNVIDAPTMIRQVRTVQMNAPEMFIPKIGFGSRILRAAPQGAAPYHADDGSNDRYLPAADRAKPDFGKVEMKTKEIMAEIHLTDEILEDNIERGNLTNTILQLIAERASLDLEELVLKGDTASPDAYLALHDGILKRVSTNVVDAQNGLVSLDVFNSLKKAMPTRFRRNLNAMRFFTSMDQESDYRVKVASRGTDLGDAATTGNNPIPVLGVPMQGVALMPEANALFMNPQNVVWGLQRNVRIERERDIRGRQWIIVLTMRVAITIEEEAATVKLINLGSS